MIPVTNRESGFYECSYEIATFEHGLRAISGTCECCGCPDGVELEESRTTYLWDDEGPNPNRRLQFCRSCANDYHAFRAAIWGSTR